MDSNSHLTWKTEKECVKAIGLEHFDPKIRKHLIVGEQGEKGSFTQLLRPTLKNAWLFSHEETPQTFEDFALERSCKSKTNMTTLTYSGRVKNNKTIIQPNRSIIYLAPIGEFIENESPSIKVLVQYAQAYFGLAVKVLPTFSIHENSDGDIIVAYSVNEINKVKELKCHQIISSRNKSSGQPLLTSDILDLLTSIRPKDAVCVMGITMKDLYPEPSWNFVLGIANIKKSVGIFSFARYSPTFDLQEKKDNKKNIEEKKDNKKNIEEKKDNNKNIEEKKDNKKNIEEKKNKLNELEQGILLYRSCRVMVHEISHLFHIEHCQYYNCVMLGANSVEEESTHPLELCTCCLSKLLHLIPSTNILQRYHNLLKFYNEIIPKPFSSLFAKDIEWMENRVKLLSFKY